MQYVKSKLVPLRQAGYDERWLQNLILDDPSILGLGDLVVYERERRQSSGGRIDFLMYDPDANAMFEIEVMLGRLDESHIIRGIEYWDIERRRWPNREHRAVLVAEEITNRFFNVIGLLNRSIPMIAIQLSAVQVGDQLTLTFTRVLDIYEPPVDEELEVDPTDRAWWIKHGTAQALQVVDRLASLVTVDGKPLRLTYNKNHIAMGGARQNFGWLHPRKAGHCHVHLRLRATQVEGATTQLGEAGLEVSPRSDGIALRLTPEDLTAHAETVASVIRLSSEEATSTEV
jgi:hypothetical protein